jgi:hypothetical protein
MIERFGLVDMGLAWQSAASGRTVYLGPEFAAMVAAAQAGAFDILVVGYVSRFSATSARPSTSSPTSMLQGSSCCSVTSGS